MNPKKEKIIQLAWVDSNYTNGRPRLIFDGESTISGKAYPYLSSSTPQPNDRLMVVKGVVVGKIVGGERHQSKCTGTKCLFYSSNKLGVIIMQKVLFVFLGMFLFLTACSTDSSTNVEYLKVEGYVVEKHERGGVYQLLVIGNITKDDLENKTKQELIKEAGGAYFYVKKEIYSKVREGQKVIVWIEKGQPLQLSDPPETSAKKIEIINENEKKAPKYQQCAEGYIINKNGDSIWVISRIEKDDIKNKTKKELNKLFQGKGVIFDIRNISQETKMRLKEKQKVKVYCNGILKESAPSQGEAIKIEVLEE